MQTFKSLKRASKSSVSGKEKRLAILGNCATQFFSVAIEGHAKLNNMNLCVYDTDYNQIDAQLLDPNSETYGFNPDYILLYLATDKLYEEFLDESLSERNGFAEEIIEKLDRYWTLIASNAGCRIIQLNFTEIQDNALGSYGAKVDCTFLYQIRKLNYLLQEKMSTRKDVYPVDLLGIQVQLGEYAFYDSSLYYNAKMTISIDALPYVAKAVIDVIKAMNGNIKKCVICDLDNTLWGGVIGDDGMGGIEIGELGRGHAFTDLQRWLKQLK